jgi:glycine dehydrogenase subunit 2
MDSEPLIFELGSPGRDGVRPPIPQFAHCDVADVLPAAELRENLPIPEVSEVDVMRHFLRLSHRNHSVDTAMYPLGSCTMKYNPKINEVTARLPGLSGIHPYQPESTVQGALQLICELEADLAQVTGFTEVSTQPAAGSQCELAGILGILAYHQSTGEERTRVLIPDSAHGTNPATGTMSGLEVTNLPTDQEGGIDLSELDSRMDSDVAAIMLTLPSTLGLFERRILDVVECVHAAGAQVYCDGANMNAMLGRVRPGDLGIDVMHLNLHKTFSTPHGGGGPGAGALAVKEHLVPFLPGPRVVRRGESYELDDGLDVSIGRIHSHLGNFGNLVRAYTYIRSLGTDGLREAANDAVLNANYLRARLAKDYDLPYDRMCMHEVVFAGTRQKRLGVRTLDIAKRLIDYGIHPPTIYFPAIVDEALMIEPTETESLESLDRFVDVMQRIAREVESDPQKLHDAPVKAPVRRLDEVTANRQPDVRFVPDGRGS